MPGRWLFSEKVLHCSRAVHVSLRGSSTTQLLFIAHHFIVILLDFIAVHSFCTLSQTNCKWPAQSIIILMHVFSVAYLLPNSPIILSFVRFPTAPWQP
jgi:hypothetical protein